MAPPSALRIRVWDLPTRLFHWILAATIAGSIITVNAGGNWMIWHGRLGYLALTLVLFRLAWGIVGGHYARFVNFVPGPSKLFAYLRRPASWRGMPGHNPLGSLSIVALLAAVAFQATSGLFAFDQIAFEGPLSRRVGEATVSWLTGLHRLNKYVIVGLIALHVAAIAYHRLRHGERLVGPMVSGDKTIAEVATASRDDAALRIRGLLVLVSCALLVGAVVYLGSS